MSGASTDRHALLFTAPWSIGSCLLAKEVREHQPPMRVEEVDVEADPAKADRHLVVSIPTLVIFEKGKERGRLLGSMSIEDIRRAVRGQESTRESTRGSGSLSKGQRRGRIRG